MEYYQEIQNQAAQTAAVIKQFFPTMSIAGISALQLAAQAQDLGQRAQQRDDALVAFDAANSAEDRSFLTIRALILALPRMAQGELDDGQRAHDRYPLTHEAACSPDKGPAASPVGLCRGARWPGARAVRAARA